MALAPGEVNSRRGSSVAGVLSVDSGVERSFKASASCGISEDGGSEMVGFETMAGTWVSREEDAPGAGAHAARKTARANTNTMPIDSCPSFILLW